MEKLRDARATRDVREIVGEMTAVIGERSSISGALIRPIASQHRNTPIRNTVQLH